jgi:cation:H+ antiporter
LAHGGDDTARPDRGPGSTRAKGRPLTLLAALGLLAAGLALLLWSAERLVEGVVGTSLGWGVSAFVLSVVFVGFDPENLAVGAAGAMAGMPGIALGSVIGAAMVAAGLAFGVTALISPMHFARAPLRVLLVPLAAIALLGALALDGMLSRTDGLLLLLAFAAAILELLRLSRRGLEIRARGEVAEALERPPRRTPHRAFGLLLISLGGLVIGSELLLAASEHLLARFDLSETAFGMTILALVVSLEELARELPAARRGRAEISFGNVAGSILAFFLCNAGLIALLRPLPVEPAVLRFHLPLCFLTAAFGTGCLAARRVPRWAGAILLLQYGIFFAGACLG